MTTESNDCAFCGSNATMRCSRCNVAYCNRTCQSRDWCRHRQRCGNATHVGGDEPRQKIIVENVDVEQLREHVSTDVPMQEFDELAAEVLTGGVSKIGSLEENFGKNNDTKYLPYDENIVKILKSPKSYINASWAMKRCAMLVQNPRRDNVDLFFDMIKTWNERNPVIFAFVSNADVHNNRGFVYWPTEIDKTVTYDKYSLTLKEISDSSDRNMFHGMFVLSWFSKTMEITDSCRIEIYAYSGWDIGTIPSDPLPIMRLARKASTMVSDVTNPIIVHCTTAAVRAGTFIAMVSALKLFYEGIVPRTISIKRIVRQLRSERPGIVDRVDLYRFIYQVVVANIIDDPKLSKEIHFK